jgi:hypothetical protein
MLDGECGPEVQAALAAHGFTPGGKRPPLEALMLVPIATSVGVSTDPAHLVGYGPVAAEHAAQLLLDARVRLATTDHHGRIVAIGDTSIDLRDPNWAEQLQPFQTTSETSTDTGRTDPGHDAAGGDLPAGHAERAWQHRLREHLRQRLGEQGLGRLLADLPLPDPVVFPDAPTSSGLPLPPVAEPQYRPSRRLARLVQARDLHCVGVGCSVPSRQCDLEHCLPWPHGPTSAQNLSPVSRHCHHAKQAGWRYERHPDGSTTWYAPYSRRRYTVQPDL